MKSSPSLSSLKFSLNAIFKKVDKIDGAKPHLSKIPWVENMRFKTKNRKDWVLLKFDALK